MYRLDPQYRLVFGSGGQVDATPDVERMKAQIASISPADAGRLEAYFRDNREKLQRFTPILQTAFESWRDLLRPEMLRMLPLVRPWRSLDSDLRKYFQDERIRLGGKGPTPRSGRCSVENLLSRGGIRRARAPGGKWDRL